MENENTTYEKLKNKVEHTAGRKMTSPRDFDYLSMHILNTTHSYLSAITLKRFWGYLGEGRKTKPYRFTLNTLAQYAGYADFEAFSNNASEKIESSFLNNNSLQTGSLPKGCNIRLTWHPDRCITIQYEGMEMFKVTESINSKLSVGDTFFCSSIIDGEPLFLRCLIHNGATPTNYVCGRINGVKFNITD